MTFAEKNVAKLASCGSSEVQIYLHHNNLGSLFKINSWASKYYQIRRHRIHRNLFYCAMQAISDTSSELSFRRSEMQVLG